MAATRDKIEAQDRILHAIANAAIVEKEKNAGIALQIIAEGERLASKWGTAFPVTDAKAA